MLTVTAAEVHRLKEDFVHCLNDKFSQPGTYAGVPDKKVQVPNCVSFSATSDNYNLELKLDVLPGDELLNGEERFLSDGKNFTGIVSSVSTTSAESMSNIEGMGQRSYKDLDHNR